MRKRRTAAGPTRMAVRLPNQLPSMEQAVMMAASGQKTVPCQMKAAAAPTLEPRLSTLEVADASMSPARNTQCRARMRKLPVPGPKNPS